MERLKAFKSLNFLNVCGENMVQYFDRYYITDDQYLIREKYTEVHRLLKHAYWTKDRTEVITQKAINNSINYAIFEIESKQLVGFARVITDYATIYYLSDVYIHEEHRGRGLGKKIVEWIVLCEDKLIGINGSLKTRDAEKLYKKYGFEECKAICMVRKI